MKPYLHINVTLSFQNDASSFSGFSAGKEPGVTMSGTSSGHHSGCRLDACAQRPRRLSGTSPISQEMGERLRAFPGPQVEKTTAQGQVCPVPCWSPTDPSDSYGFCLQFSLSMLGHTCFGWKGSQAIPVRLSPSQLCCLTRGRVRPGCRGERGVGPP